MGEALQMAGIGPEVGPGQLVKDHISPGMSTLCLYHQQSEGLHSGVVVLFLYSFCLFYPSVFHFFFLFPSLPSSLPGFSCTKSFLLHFIKYIHVRRETQVNLTFGLKYNFYYMTNIYPMHSTLYGTPV